MFNDVLCVIIFLVKNHQCSFFNELLCEIPNIESKDFGTDLIDIRDKMRGCLVIKCLVEKGITIFRAQINECFMIL